ncbi:MAG: DUF378 domain-containing protein [Peptococcaceae bacterium]|nr:DUF378 domain-containing protein [Peptococcaceae bacterium]
MKDWLYKTALVLTIIGAVNWGLIGLFNLNFVAMLFGVGTILTKVIYTLIGLGGLTTIGLLFMDIERETIHDHERSIARSSY